MSLVSQIDDAEATGRYVPDGAGVRARRLDPGWSGQDDAQRFLESCQAEPGQLRARVYERSPFRDGLAYGFIREGHRIVQHAFQPLSIGRTPFVGSPLSWPGWARVPGMEASEQLAEVVDLFAHAVTIDADGDADERLADHLLRHAPRLLAAATSAGADGTLMAIMRAAAHEDPRVIRHRLPTGTPQPFALAEVLAADEELICAALLDAGAVVEDNDMVIPEYESMHELHPGRRFAVTVDGASVHYVPHWSISTERTVMYEHTARWSWAAGDRQRLLAERIADIDGFCAARVCETHAGDVVSRVLVGDDEPAYARLRPGRREGDGAVEVVWDATDDDLARPASDYGLVGDGPVARRRGRIWVRQADADALDGLRDAIERLRDVRVRWTSSEADGPEGSEHSLRIRDERVARRTRGRSWTEAMRTCLAEHGTWEHETTRRQTRTMEHHRAPASERGLLRADGMTVDALARLLTSWGLPCVLRERVPWNWLYGGERRVGFCTPLADEYARGSERLRLPENTIVLHGMTSAEGNTTTALENLRQIIRTGGLKSIAERRRMGIQVRSMSPRGDIASGIDHGVPCKIGASSCYGTYVFFGMRPDILLRRDVWFSDTDFGGCVDRYDRYAEYARGIGQPGIFEPCPHAARQTHLDEGIGDNDNEAYFRREIPWTDIDTVWVMADVTVGATSLYEAALREVEEAKTAGKLPDHVRVEAFGGDDGLDELLADRARALAADR